jgi:cytochrome P450
MRFHKQLLILDRISTPDWCWVKLFDPFEKYGDVFISVSPSRNIVWTASAEAIQQITQHRDTFPKPLESYAILDLYGRNIVTTEGAEWKKHRKVISPGLNEKNNALVFKESITQTQGMLRRWTGLDGRGNVTLTDVPRDSMRVTLHVITKVGFGVGLSWPGEERNQADEKSTIDYASSEVPNGFTMTFEHSLVTLLDSLLWVLIFPGWLLSKHTTSSCQVKLADFRRVDPDCSRQTIT